MKIDGVILFLESVRKKYGNMEVLLSSDEEGNSYGTISPKSFSPDASGVLIIYPWEHIQPGNLPANRNPGRNTYNTIQDVRNAFWEYGVPPSYLSEFRKSKRQNEYSADVRMMFVGFVDNLARNGDISEALAQRVTL